MIVTERLILRRWTGSDRAPFAAMNADPEVMEHYPSLLDPAASDALVDRIEAQFEELGYGLWALEVRSTGEFIGYTGLLRQTFAARFTPTVEVGWRLARPAWRQGYATEAARSSLDRGFTTLGLDEIVSMTAVGNVRSRRVMQRLGMTHDPADDFLHPNVEAGSPLQPHVLYRIRREAWLQRS